jgi:hypothetical protein
MKNGSLKLSPADLLSHFLFRASLRTSFSYVISIFIRKNKLIFFWENENPLKKCGFQASS